MDDQVRESATPRRGAPVEVPDSEDTEVAEPMKSARGRGPRASRGEVRQRILKAATKQFLEYGYDKTMMSHIAQDAGCTPAMVTYYFKSKQRLFRECFNLPIDPAAMIVEALMDGREGAGERVVRRAFQLYEEDLTADTMRLLMLALMTDAVTSQRFRDYVRKDILGVVGRTFGLTDELAEEIEFAIATMFGVVTMRYILRLEPIASMPRERLVRELAPIVQHRIDRTFARRDLRGGSAGRGAQRT